MGLQAMVYARDSSGINVFVCANSRRTAEALAKALGLNSAYGVANPDEPGDYLSEEIDSIHINWMEVEAIKGLEWISGLQSMRAEVDKGYTLIFDPSY